MQEQIVKNILIFLERVPVTGKESVAWCEAVMALNQELKPTTELTIPPEA